MQWQSREIPKSHLFTLAATFIWVCSWFLENTGHIFWLWSLIDTLALAPSYFCCLVLAPLLVNVYDLKDFLQELRLCFVGGMFFDRTWKKAITVFVPRLPTSFTIYMMRLRQVGYCSSRAFIYLRISFYMVALSWTWTSHFLHFSQKCALWYVTINYWKRKQAWLMLSVFFSTCVN